MRYYFREPDECDKQRYSRISSSSIYDAFHSFVCSSSGLVSEDYSKFYGFYDLSADLEFNRVDDLCKKNKWEI